MARFTRKQGERGVSRKLTRHIICCMASIFFLMMATLFVRSIKTSLNDVQTLAFPINQLERGYVSRQGALDQLKEFIANVKTHANFRNMEQTSSIFNQTKTRYVKQIFKDLGILQNLGLATLVDELRDFLSEELLKPEAEEEDSSQMGDSSDHENRFFVTHRFCYQNAHTPQGNYRQVDPSFCPRLLQLLNDIQHGQQPPLLTLFTWLPDPMIDADRLKRRLLFDNWNLLRPLVQPVVFSDSRTNMALANLFDWPCLPVTNYSSFKVPLFKFLATTVTSKFNSTFYGYVRPTSIFDASLVETLLKIKETYIDKYGGNSGFFKKGDQTSRGSEKSIPPVLVYGRAHRANRLGGTKALWQVSGAVNVTEGRDWEEKKDSLVYLLFSGISFDDIPDLIVDDKYLTPILVSRSMALGHQVVDASGTVYSVHTYQNKTTSDWGRHYLTDQRDPFINRRLGSQYFHAHGMKKPNKYFHEVATKFSSSGNIYIDVRAEDSIHES